MDGLTVTFRNLETRCFQGGRPIQADEPISKFDELEDRLPDDPRMRSIVVRVLPPWPLACFHLHWSDQQRPQ